MLLNTVHSRGFIHGNLDCANVLIDDSGRARLADFSLSMTLDAFAGTEFMPDAVGGALRFRPLELMPPLEGYVEFDPILSPAGDIYSLASVILQVCQLIRLLIF